MNTDRILPQHDLDERSRLGRYEITQRGRDALLSACECGHAAKNHGADGGEFCDACECMDYHARQPTEAFEAPVGR